MIPEERQPMEAKEFVKAADDGMTLLRTCENMPSLAFSKHPNGTYVYMDVAHSIYVTVDKITAVTVHEILGWVGDAPVLTIKTEEWFA